MQVYLIESDGITDENAAFRNFRDIEASIAISYSACKDVKITLAPQASGGPIFTVTGIRADETATFTETFKVHRVAVWDSPTHL